MGAFAADVAEPEIDRKVSDVKADNFRASETPVRHQRDEGAIAASTIGDDTPVASTTAPGCTIIERATTTPACSGS